MSVQGSVPDSPVRPIRIKAAHPGRAQFGQRLTSVPLPSGLPSEEEIYDELDEYCAVLLGRKESPIDSPYLTLAEVATGYYARALEIDMLIHRLEDEGTIKRGDWYYRIRTGVLRSFIEMSKRMADLGSRRLTQEDLISRQRRDSGERV